MAIARWLVSSTYVDSQDSDPLADIEDQMLLPEGIFMVKIGFVYAWADR